MEDVQTSLSAAAQLHINIYERCFTHKRLEGPLHLEVTGKPLILKRLDWCYTYKTLEWHLTNKTLDWLLIYKILDQPLIYKRLDRC